MSYLELQEFVKYATGSPHIHGNSVTIDFISREGMAMTVSTCAKTFTMSTPITDYESFASGLHLLMGSKQFTMP